MTSDLISKKEAIETVEFYKTQYDGIFWAIRGLEDIEPVDAAPVVHGKWIESYDAWEEIIIGECSICGAKVCGDDMSLIEKFYPYCSNCGAKMDGGNK